jgi:hypothetical protein
MFNVTSLRNSILGGFRLKTHSGGGPPTPQSREMFYHSCPVIGLKSKWAYGVGYILGGESPVVCCTSHPVSIFAQG